MLISHISLFWFKNSLFHVIQSLAGKCRLHISSPNVFKLCLGIHTGARDHLIDLRTSEKGLPFIWYQKKT